jgi:hypothetical protein
LLTGVNAQVEVGKAKNTIMGKGKLVAMPASELLFDHFQITFNLYKFAEDQGGSSNVALSAKVGVKARLKEVDEALAQEITNEGYAYFVEQWKKRGVTLTFAPKADLEASKAFEKARKKNKPTNIINGGVWNNEGKKVHMFVVWPEGVDIASSGEGLSTKFGNAAHFFALGTGRWTSFNASIDFITFKTAKLGSAASVKSRPQLSLTGGLTTNTWEKYKVGAYLGSITADGIEDFYSDVVDQNLKALNIKMVNKHYIADKTRFKANVMEMIKSSIDASFADYDEVVAKNSP